MSLTEIIMSGHIHHGDLKSFFALVSHHNFYSRDYKHLHSVQGDCVIWSVIEHILTGSRSIALCLFEQHLGWIRYKALHEDMGPHRIDVPYSLFNMVDSPRHAPVTPMAQAWRTRVKHYYSRVA